VSGGERATFEFVDVSVQRNGAHLLRDVSLTIAPCGVTVLVGPSGAGKSTLLRCCNRLEAPTSGTIRFGGVDLTTLDPLQHRRRVAMVFQQPVVFPGSILDNLRAGSPSMEVERAHALLARVGLDAAMVDREADTLSGGEAQRVVLARALATDPQVLLADEPTSALDDRATAKLEELGTALSRDGIPIVWVTHDLGQARRLADHLVVLDRGTVAFSGMARTPQSDLALSTLERAPDHGNGEVGHDR
jgi:putative ABC transport system ATP-binding protein